MQTPTSSDNSLSKPRIFYGYVIVGVGFLTLAIMWGTLYAFGVFFNPLLGEFGWTRAMTSGAFSLSVVLLAGFSVVAGRLTDRFGPRIVITAGGLLLGMGCLLMSLVNSVWQLYLFYGVIMGIGMGTSFVPVASTIARWFVRRRGMMTGITVSGLGVGTLIMSPLANWLIANYGWRNSYITMGIAVLVLVVSSAQFLRRDPSQKGQLPDGASHLEEKSNAEGKGFSLSQAAHTRQFWMLDMAALFFGISLGTVLVHIVPHAVGMGFSATEAALVLALVGGGGTTGRVIMGITCDRIGNRQALVICFGFIAGSSFLLLVSDKLWELYLFAILFGFGYGGMSALVSPITAELFGLSSHGAILGLVASIGGDGGSAVGSVAAGYIFDVTGSYYMAFLICAIISTISLLLVLLLKLSPLPRS
jgi:MFS family permease